MKATSIDCGGWGYLHTKRGRQEPAVCGLMRSDSNDSENRGMEQRGEGTLLWPLDSMERLMGASGSPLKSPRRTGGSIGVVQGIIHRTCSLFNGHQASKRWFHPNFTPPPKTRTNTGRVRSKVNFIKDKASICHFVGLYQTVMLKLYPES